MEPLVPQFVHLRNILCTPSPSFWYTCFLPFASRTDKQSVILVTPTEAFEDGKANPTNSRSSPFELLDNNRNCSTKPSTNFSFVLQNWPQIGILLQMDSKHTTLMSQLKILLQYQKLTLSRLLWKLQSPHNLTIVTMTCLLLPLR